MDFRYGGDSTASFTSERVQTLFFDKSAGRARKIRSGDETNSTHDDHKISRLKFSRSEAIRENRENFVPRKFLAIRYYKRSEVGLPNKITTCCCFNGRHMTREIASKEEHQEIHVTCNRWVCF